MAPTKESGITCLCGAVQETGSLLADPFPAETDLCHCNPCRYTTGAHWTTTNNLRAAPRPASLANCTAYNASNTITRYFCSTCGSCTFIYIHKQDRWVAFSGTIDPPPAGSDVVKVIFQAWINDTDGKLAARLHQDGVPCYREGSDQPAMSKDEVLNPATESITKQDSVEARCHCGSVAFQLLRPNWEGVDPTFIPPKGHRDKFEVSFCLCRSCRLALGASSCQAWAFVPPAQILGPEGPLRISVEEGVALEGVRSYRSSPGVSRSFCKTCGATVFYRALDQPSVVDVAASLIRAPEGSMASSWLWWRWDRVYSDTEQVDREIVSNLLRVQEQIVGDT